MTVADRFLAIDWGTTNRRVYLIEDGQCLRTERDHRGVRATPQGSYEAELAGIRQRFGDLPVVMAGMVGSSIGWQAAPYVEAPANFARLTAAILRMDERTVIVPGVCQKQPADVMRGEEVQVLGAVAAGMAAPDSLLCHPGTHCKWTRMQEGVIASFTTAMTGELFALLREHSILGPSIANAVADNDAFRLGVIEGAKGDLQAALFGIRARTMLGDAIDESSFASGLLIGNDVSRRITDDPIPILADETVGGLYRSAIETLGGTASIIDSHACFLAGILQIRDHLS